MIANTQIDWRPIEAMPEDRKDGRYMLFWHDRKPFIAYWANGRWLRSVSRDWDGEAPSPTYWADINSPI